MGDGTFRVDSFFDVDYEIDFVGAPGGALDGLSGSTQGTTTLRAQDGFMDAIEPDRGDGTVILPPESSSFISHHDPLQILDGLPPGTQIQIVPKLWVFLCDSILCGQPGGALGGESESFQATLELELTGLGTLSSYVRTVSMPVAIETHSGPRNPGDPSQIFDRDMFDLQGTVLGDPDFASLTLTAGSSNALPSPGHTTLTDRLDGTFLVDSFFDIDYQIDFVGAPGGALDGLSGSTQGETRFTVRGDSGAPARRVTIAVNTSPNDTVDVDFAGDLGSFSLDDDNDAALPGYKLFANVASGTYTVSVAMPSVWTALGITCNDPDVETAVDLANSQVAIDLDLGEDITCTFRGLETAAILFVDGFETGDVTAWSRSVSYAP